MTGSESNLASKGLGFFVLLYFLSKQHKKAEKVNKGLSWVGAHNRNKSGGVTRAIVDSKPHDPVSKASPFVVNSQPLSLSFGCEAHFR